ncbi:outer membrane lipoprotein-sorting protein [Archangium violaceum]|uniref:outer membrane lipoprotein-sorting protein n=1 Tax=Archangium violaceum TaxID=83451 RepID=UPI001950F10E|nr:outer membrane lipoprotein-sorting protein [Archangium violaceum]QRN95012.1 outer membrane lipoprotein-sorting protein [Archangium violaceum]
MKPRALVSSCVLALALLQPALAGAADKVANVEKAATAEKATSKASPAELLRIIDKRMGFASDYKGIVRMREIRKDGVEKAFEMNVYRRDSAQDLLFLITQPRNMAGGGYLRIGKNLWEYNVAVGQWERTTRRANIIGTIACEGDFDRSRLSEDYEAKDEGEETINGTAYRKLMLTAKPEAEVNFPMLRLWVDPDHNIVKRVGYAPSGKTLRTDIIRSYQRLKDPVSGQTVYHYKEVLELEEEEGTQMVVKYEQVELAPLSPNIFTKSWLEGRIR